MGRFSETELHRLFQQGSASQANIGLGGESAQICLKPERRQIGVIGRQRGESVDLRKRFSRALFGSGRG
jgi:hypothetical protein